jgi:hypothetical protein
MPKKKVFLAGEVFKLTDLVTVTEMCMQMRLDNWLGKGTVTVKLNKPNDDEVEITIFRKYGSFYEPESHRVINPNSRSLFSFDRQFILGLKYQTGGQANLSINEGYFTVYEDLDDFFKEYRKHAREMKATRPKEILFEDDWNFMKLTLKY